MLQLKMSGLSGILVAAVLLLFAGCDAGGSGRGGERTGAPPGAPGATPAKYVSAKVYFIPWYADPAQPLGPQEVRQSAKLRLDIRDRDEASQVAASAGVTRLPEMTRVEPRNLRLVLDFRTETGRTESFYSDGMLLMNHDGSRGRIIDDEFRRAFCEELRNSSDEIGFGCEEAD